MWLTTFGSWISNTISPYFWECIILTLSKSQKISKMSFICRDELSLSNSCKALLETNPRLNKYANAQIYRLNNELSCDGLIAMKNENATSLFLSKVSFRVEGFSEKIKMSWHSRTLKSLFRGKISMPNSTFMWGVSFMNHPFVICSVHHLIQIPYHKHHKCTVRHCCIYYDVQSTVYCPNLWCFHHL